MRELLCLLCMAVLSVRSQIYPRFEHPSNTYLNNSFIDRGVISQDSSALRCVTDHTPCCDSGDGDWRDPQGVEVHEGISGATELYVTRGTGTISLNRISGGSSGMWRCNIPDSSGDMQSMYIYLGNSSTGSLRSAVVSFTSLHTQANVDPPQFTLTCRSEGGPAMNVSWQRSSQMIEEDGDHVTSQILVATEENTVYENKLTVTGREAGQYQCTVSSNRDEFFGATGSTVTSEEFEVEVAGEPDRVNAVQKSDTSILVTWDPPGDPVTGYKVFYEPGAGFLEVTGGSAERIMLENLQNGVEYSIYVVALSAHLPSTVVGPITLSTLTPPTVTIAQTPPAYAGSTYTLTCQVTVPDGIVVSGNPQVEFEGPGTSDPVTGTVFGGNNVYFSTYSPMLTLSSGGDYTCSATYSVNGDTSMSPVGSATLTVDVLIAPPVINVGIENMAVPYLGNNITLACVVVPDGVTVGTDVNVNLTRTKDGSRLESSNRVTVHPAMTHSLGVSYEGKVDFMLLMESDSGIYRCEAVIFPTMGNVSPRMASGTFNLNVITPSVTVMTDPSSLRVLDDPAYNQFSITCTASADAGGTAIALEVIAWERRVGTESFQPVPTSSYTRTGDAVTGYESVLMGTETTVATIQFRCTAALAVGSTVGSSGTTILTVTGPTLPGPLASVRFTDVEDDRVVIQWTVPSITYTPETYAVMFGRNESNLVNSSDDEVTSGRDINAEDLALSVTLSDLQPVTTYYYKVVATNSHGNTESDVKMFTTTARTTSPPTAFTVDMGPNPLTYIFSWSRPVNLYNSIVLSYAVTCMAGGLEIGNITINNSTTTVTLILGHGLTYRCCVLASNDAGPSDDNCLDDGITTPETEPSGPPQGFEILAGSTTLTFTWDPPLLADRNGRITSYTIQCSGSLTFSPATSPYTATGLTANTSYTCSIYASNAQGDGPAVQITVSTLEAAPDAAPRDFRHSVMNGVADVTFEWRPPPEDRTNGVITQYTITCDPGPVATTSGREESLSVASLSPGTRYSCTISASTSAGEGPQSAPITVLTVPSAPQDVNVSVVETETEVGLRVSWSEVGGSVTGYNLEVNRMDRGDTFTNSTTGTSYTVTSLAVGGYERVSVQVTAVNSAGYGPASDPQISRTPSIPPGAVGGVLVNVSEGEEVTVSWQRPDYPNGLLTGYTVSVELYEGGSMVIGPVDVNTTLSTVIDISSLEDGVPYNVTVVAVNDKGPGLTNRQLFFSKELTAGVVELERERSEDGKSIRLSWMQPSPVQARGNIAGYQIDFIEATAGEGTRRRRQGDCQSAGCVLAAGQVGGCCLVGGDQTSAMISGLDPGKAYNVSVSAVNGAGKGESRTFTVDGGPGPSPESESGLPIAVVAGGVAGGAVLLVLVVAIVIVIIVIYRRKNAYSYQAHPNSPSPTLDDKPARLGAARKKGEEMTTFAATNIERSPEELARLKPIEVDQFAEHVRQMHQDRDKGFEEEYQSLSTQQVASNDAAKKNKNKNRFANIYPYDHNRVRLLDLDGVEGSDYINASFIDGYSRSSAYIAAQGPMGGTISDFWRMIWEHKPTTIVMLTKQVEGGKRKCEVYWPEKVGDTFNAGAGINVLYKELIPFADYEIKVFSVTHAGKSNAPPLEVHHFQFLSWPDHGVPQFATALISFIRRLRQHHHEQSAMVVHCSAGVGRTGAFILLDSMLERIMSESTVNVYEFLTHMRRQRVFMVQTLAQYVFIHDALDELITCGDTSISSSDLRARIRKMHKIVPEKTISGFTDQFRLLQRVSRRPTDSDNSDALEPYNKEKNRYPNRVPYNMNRIRLRPTGVTGAEYINASYLDGYKQRNAYLATQAPLQATVNDFWRMMWEFKSRAIVMLCQLVENGEEMSYQYWPTQHGARQLYGKNFITLISEEELSGTPEVTVRKFEITDDKNTSTFSITQYQVVGWLEQGRANPQVLIKLIDQLNKLQRSTENKPITVMCNDGMGRTGTFVCIHAMLERMNAESVVDFFQFVKSSRISRPDIVREQEHYILCHDTVADYLDNFGTYANFKV